MKRLLATLTLVAAMVASVHGQGRILFNNTLGGGMVTVGTPNQGASGGAAGSALGTAYSIQLMYVSGTVTDQGAFNAAAIAGPITQMAAFGPGSEGIYDFGPQTGVAVGPAGTYTIQARAWFNNGQFGQYSEAFAAQMNTGLSELKTILATAAPTPANSTAFSAFTVTSPIPEPSTFALAGLGAAALLLIRRRK
jgi:hypothetical protein